MKWRRKKMVVAAVMQAAVAAGEGPFAGVRCLPGDEDDQA